jgi:hypothetical protein
MECAKQQLFFFFFLLFFSFESESEGQVEKGRRRVRSLT